jgi:hypothetical protein
VANGVAGVVADAAPDADVCADTDVVGDGPAP